MKILKFDKRKGIAKIIANNLDDIWHLSKIIEKGDLVYGKTTRKIKLGKEEERGRAIKKTISLLIEIDRLDFEVDQLRLHGNVAKETGDIPLGAAHSLEIIPGSEIKIEKKWKGYQIERLEEAAAARSAPKIVICVLDDEQANFAILTGVGVKTLGKISLRLAKKRLAEKSQLAKDTSSKLGKVIAEVIRLNEQFNPNTIIFGSPLFWKEILLKAVKEKDGALAKKIRLEDISTGSKRGINELINRGAIEKVIKQSRLQKEFKLVEQVLKEIAKDGAVMYGFNEVKKAAEIGAVTELLITDEFIQKRREKDQYKDVEEIIDLVEQADGKVHIIASDHEAGRELKGLTGIACLLRFKVD